MRWTRRSLNCQGSKCVALKGWLVVGACLHYGAPSIKKTKKEGWRARER